MGRPPQPSRWSATKPWIAALLLVLLCARAALVLSLSNVFFYGEELEHGAVAKAVLDRIDLPYQLLPYHGHEGGGFVVAHVLAVVFAVLGECLLAQKVVALAFTAGTLVVGIRVADRFLGPPAGMVFGLLFALSPVSMQKLSLMCLGTHHEAAFFMVLLVYLTLLLALERRDSRWLFAAFGFVTGFGIYFNYQLLLIAGLSALWLVAARWRTLLGSAGAALLGGFALGIAPLLAMAAGGVDVLDIHGQALLDSANERQRTLSLAEVALRALRAGPMSTATFLGIALLVLLALWGTLRPDRCFSRAAGLFLVGYLALFAAAYEMSGFQVSASQHWISSMRLYPAQTVALILAAGGAGVVLRSRSLVGRTAAAVGIAAALLGGAADLWHAARAGTASGVSEAWAELTTTKGYSYQGYFLQIVPRLDLEPERELACLLTFSEPHPELLADAVAAAVLRDPRIPDGRIGALCRGAPAPLEHLLPGVGFRLVVRAGQSAPSALAAVDQLQLPPAERALVEEGIGRHVGWRRPPLAAWLGKQVAEAGERALPEDYVRGLGHSVYLAFALDPTGAARFLESAPPGLAGPLRAGYEEGRRIHHLP